MTRPPAAPLVLIPSQANEEDLQVARDALDGAGRLEVLEEEGEARDRQLQEAKALLVFAWRVGDEEIPLLRGLRLVQSVWAGVDRIPVGRLRAHDPELLIASGSGPNAPQVAEHALGLYLDCAKGITRRDRDMRQGGWLQHMPGRLVAGSRVAVLGLGAIGRRVARGLLAMDAEVVAVTRDGKVQDPGLAQEVEATTLAGLHEKLGGLGGVVLCLPLTEATEGLVDRGFLRALGPEAILVNVARGRLVDETALYGHLRDHPGFTAGLDVWWRYPKDGRPRDQHHPFEALENVVMTPHSAFNVPGARADMIRNAARNVARVLRGDAPSNLVKDEQRG